MTPGREVPFPQPWVDRITRHPADGGPSGADWLRTVPGLIDEGLERWELTVDGPPATGWTAIVVPVRRGDEQLALKVGWPHPEGTQEHLVLRTWGGRGAVRLTAAEPSRGLLLLERLDATRDLRSEPIDVACRETGLLLRQLNFPAGEPFPCLAPYLQPHLERMADRSAVPRRIVTRTQGLARELLTDDVPAMLLHTDLHYENVLARPGASWVAIDPKPVVGHPAFELLPLLHNRTDELDGRSFRDAMRRRVVIAAEAAGIDVDEAFAWTLLRAGIEVSWAVGMDDPDDVTLFIALTKALDD